MVVLVATTTYLGQNAILPTAQNAISPERILKEIQTRSNDCDFPGFPLFCFVPSVSLVLLLQVCWYFPLKEQIGRLIKIPAYRELLMYEQKHRTNVGVMCDIYDSPRWAKIVGPIGDRLERIVVHVAVDGVPAFGRKNCQNISSVKPIISS